MLVRGGDPRAGNRGGGFGGSLLVSKTPADTTKYYPIAAGTSRWQQIRRDTAMDQQILRRNMHERQRYLAKKIRGNKTEGRSNAKHSPATPFAPRGAVADIYTYIYIYMYICIYICIHIDYSMYMSIVHNFV